ncbi:MAG: hypothetical protein IPQ07_24135 [Myxococcales bacterium]|nr:hypothetical protein [Myxococcales bacterium]
MSDPARATDTRLARAIFVTTLAVYLLSSGREPPWGDANVQYMAAESMVRHGTIDIPKPWPDDQSKDADGKWYSTYPLITSLVQIPGLVLLGAAKGLSPSSIGLAKPVTTHLACSLFGAWACVLFFRLCRQRKLSPRASSLATAIVAFATITWVYAHYSYSEIAQTAAFTGFVLHLLVFDEAPTRKHARALGLFAGLLFATKYIYAPGILGGLLVAIWRKRALKRELVPLALHAAAIGLPFVVASMIYNAMCFGSPFTTGYSEYFARHWGENSMSRLWAMFLSPGKSIFLYSPPLILGIAALPRLWREHRDACITALASIVPVLLVYSRYKLNGDWSWGYRFCVFMTPTLALSIGVLIDAWQREPARRVRRAVLAVVVAAGISVQLLGQAFYWDHFVRISQDVRIAWLGSPDRSGAIIPTRANGRCDGCFEDVHQLEWLPPFQPIVGHWWLLRSLVADADAATAEADAPWHRYTSTPFNIKDGYDRARLDWWGLLWIKDYPRTRTAGLVLLLLMLAGTGAGIRLWLRAHRAST